MSNLGDRKAKRLNVGTLSAWQFVKKLASKGYERIIFRIARKKSLTRGM